MLLLASPAEKSPMLLCIVHAFVTSRRGGGVAVYVSNRLSSSLWKPASDQSDFQLMWVRVQSNEHDAIIGAIYHPPKPIYAVADLLCHIDSCLEAIASGHSAGGPRRVGRRLQWSQ